MIFRNIIFSALAVGIIAGSIYGIFLQLEITPIIQAAETYEVGASHSAGHADNHDHNTTESATDAQQRLLTTLLANILVGIGFAIFMIALMALHNLKSDKPPVNWKTGIGWGIGLLLTVFVAPALIGIQPEIPGTLSAPLEYRQLWWLSSVISTALGLSLLYYGSRSIKFGGLLVLLAPPVLAAGLQHETIQYSNTDAAAVKALNELTQQFLLMTSLGMLIFCILLGVLSALATTRFVRFE